MIGEGLLTSLGQRNGSLDLLEQLFWIVLFATYIYICSNITYPNQVQGIKKDYLLQVVTFVNSWLALAT